MPDAGWEISRHLPIPCSRDRSLYPGFDVAFALTTRHQRFTYVRLLENHRTEYSSPFSNNAHHQGSLPSQLVVVWNLLLQADSGGPSPISDKAFTAHDLAALLQVFLAALRSLAENHDVVPVDPLLALALLVCVRLVGRDRKARHRLPPGRKMPQFRVLTQMANQSYSFQRHFFSSFMLCASRLQPGLRALLYLFACSCRSPFHVASSAPGVPSDLRSAM